jgi:hypothetical protein
MNIWFKGLISALLSGAVTGASAVFIMPVEFNQANWSKFGYMVLVGAIIGLINYLKQSPLPVE